MAASGGLSKRSQPDQTHLTYPGISQDHHDRRHLALLALQPANHVADGYARLEAVKPDPTTSQLGVDLASII